VSPKTSAAAELTWSQVHAFRLQRHHLLRRAPRRDLTTVVGAIGGAQAQLMSAAELQIAVRVDCRVAHVRDALWKDRTLVKTWLMRGTLHLVPAADLPLYAAAMRTKWMTPRASWLRFFQMTERQLADFAELIGSVLTAKPMSREELIAAVSKGRSEQVREWLRSGWGGLLKPAARRGLLCFGPSRGTSVTFVRPALWLDSWRDIDPDAALVEMARRYLRAYGPAVRSDFARWWGPSFAGAARAAWAGLANELVPVSVEGVRAEMLASELGALAKVNVGPSVQLLPAFDPYVMGHASRDHLFDAVHTRKVSRVAGWISAVVLANGRVVGTWTHTSAKGTLRIAVERFGPLSSRVKAGIRLRADAIAEATGASRAEVGFR
jgi:Winged helix DNA-binding domain